MSTKKTRPAVIVTPKGTLAYPHLTTPDSKFDANKPKYKLTLLLPSHEESTQALMKQLDVAAATAFAEQKAENPKAAKTMEMAAPYSEETDDNGNETGNIKFNIGMNAQYTDKKTGKVVQLRPALRDAKRNEINPDSVKIGGGTEARVAFRAVGYYNASSKKAGVSLQMEGVQILKLVEFGGGGNFFSDEEGFEGDDAQLGKPTAKPVSKPAALAAEGDDEF